MKVTIYHNPRCSKSRTALQLIRMAGVEVEVVEYLKTPPDVATLTDLQNKLGLPVREMMRRGEAIYKELNLDGVTDETILLEAIAKNSILLERPIIVTPKGAVIGRPPERVNELLA